MQLGAAGSGGGQQSGPQSGPQPAPQHELPSGLPFAEGSTPAGAADAFTWRSGALWCEDLSLRELAVRFGTPLYVYSSAAIVARMQALRLSFGMSARICFAVKSNSNLSILRLLHSLGAGFDLVSGGELLRLSAAGLESKDAVFAGVAKQAWEIELALTKGILFFNLESPHEVELLEAVGTKLGKSVPVAIRLNPDVEAGTHAYISTGKHDNKFGLDFASARAAIARIRATRHVQLVGYHVHLGSQVQSIDPYLEALHRVEAFLQENEQHRAGVHFYDLGGGFGVSYGDPAKGLDIAALASKIAPRIARLGLEPVIEPGRFLVAEAGCLVTTVLGSKHSATKAFTLVDAAMNDLLRPALYQAVHPIVPVQPRAGAEQIVDVVGPVCESGDFLGKARALPPLQAGDHLAVLTTGAYGASMASNYNSRPRPAEVLVSKNEVKLIRRRESYEELWAQETLGLTLGSTPGLSKGLLP